MKIEALQAILLSIIEARSVDSILQQIVRGVAAQSSVALARLWLVDKGDLCAECHLRQRCQDQSRCMHLVAGAGTSLVEGQDYSQRLNGAFRRVPFGALKVGQIAATGRPLLAAEVKPDDPWVADPAWIAAEQIKSVAGHPLVFRGEVLGVLCVFDRNPLTAQDFEWLGMFACHAAVAIANARAFEEIDRLRLRLEQENAYLQEEVQEALQFGDIVGRSPALKKVLHQIELVARTEATVLVLGESGTGKELIARAIHERSPRRHRPLIKVNCGAIPDNLFESEMFGHVKGAFTGAIKDRAGRFELADGGTIFLDEIGEIPPALQAKLLRVLQEGQFERVGDERTRKVDVRIIAATNRDLQSDAKTGRFRQDLFYRLSAFPVEIPPLRERAREDIPLLARHFLKAAARKLHLKSRKPTPEQIEQLRAYDWPGNVRELQHVVERAVILSQNGPLTFELLPEPARSADLGKSPVLTRSELRRREGENIRLALKKTNGKVFGPGGAAQLLGMKATTLASRIKALGLKG